MPILDSRLEVDLIAAAGTLQNSCYLNPSSFGPKLLAEFQLVPTRFEGDPILAGVLSRCSTGSCQVSKTAGFTCHHFGVVGADFTTPTEPTQVRTN